MTKTRALLSALCCLALVGLVALGRWQRKADTGSGPGAASATALTQEACCDCHRQIARQWRASFHSRSFADPNVQAAFQHFGPDRQCRSCHAPEPVFFAGLTAPIALRPKDQDSGVNCRTCHALPGGGVAARRTLPDAPCRPVATPQLTASLHCGGCHVAIYEDWQQSHYAQQGKTCQACHMTRDDGAAEGSTHVFRGRHDRQWVRSGVRMTSRREGDQLVVSVTNHATGHNYPGERHNRVLLLEVIQRTPDGEITLARQVTIKSITPFRGESSADQIRAGQTYQARFPIVGPPVEADIRLLYKAFPWLADRDALVVAQITEEVQAHDSE